MDSVISPGYSEKRSTGRNWLRVGVFSVVVLLVGAVVGSALTVKGWSPFKNLGGNPPLVLPENQPRVNQAITLNTGFSAVAKAVTPAVVAPSLVVAFLLRFQMRRKEKIEKDNWFLAAWDQALSSRQMAMF